MNQDMLPEDRSKVFVGVRFVLLGFDAVSKEQIYSELVEGGGVDVTRYGPDCTHLIVNSIVYDDPICSAARRDGKIVVTSLWVEHSLDLGTPVDHHSIMYIPPRDLNGIPNAKSLVICLTGYQRQDREDIMTMVGLMGANFSKPLIANKVTHLIAYKFEGEKYELAKRMKTIKVVNHRWLEDCLRSWEILQENEYDKSGYELENMMEAEAKDSEEEKEDIAIDRRGGKIAIPGSEYSKSSDQFLVKQEMSTSISQLSKFGGFSGPRSSKDLSSSASKSSQVPSFQESPKTMHREMLSTNLCRTNEELQSSVLHSSRSDSVFASNRSKKSPYSSSSRETPRKFDLSMAAEQVKSSEAGTEFVEVSLSASKSNQVPSFEKFPKATHRELFSTDLCRTNEELQSSVLHSNRSDSVFTSNRSKNSPYSCSSRETPRKFNLSMAAEQVKSSDAVFDCFNLSSEKEQDKVEFDFFNLSSEKEHEKSEFGTKTPVSIPDGYLAENRAEELVTVKSPSVHEHHDPTISNPVALCFRQGGCDEGTPQSDTAYVNEPLVENTNKAEFKNPSPVNERKGAGFSKSGEDSMSGSKSLKDRLISKKTLGSRKSFCKGDTRNQKGSIFINKTVLTSDPGSATELERNKILESVKEAEKNMRSLNDDTEAPVDQEDEVSNIPREKSTEDKDDAEDCVENCAKNRITESGKAETRKKFSVRKTTKVSEEKVPNDLSKQIEINKILESGTRSKKEKIEPVNDDTEAPEDQEVEELNLQSEKSAEEKDCAKNQIIGSSKCETRKSFSAKKTKLSESTSAVKVSAEKVSEGSKNQPKSKKMHLASKRGKEKTESVDDDTEAPEDRADEDLLKSQITKNNKTETQIKVSAKKTRLSVSTSAEKVLAGSAVKVSAEKVSEGSKNLPKSKKMRLASKRGKEKTESVDDGTEAPEDRADEDLLKGQISETNKTETRNNVSARKTRLKDSASAEKVSDEKVSEGSKNLMKRKKTSLASKRDAVSKEAPEDQENEELNVKVVNKDDAKDCAKNQTTEDAKSETRETPAKKTKLSELTSVGEKVSKVSKFLTKSKKTSVASKRAASSIEGTERKKVKTDKNVEKENVSAIAKVESEPRWFIVSGHRLQRKEFQQVIKRLKGKVCRDSHHWSYQATHFIVPSPLRRTEKFFAAASSGRWILKTDYLTACIEAGRLLDEEPYEWHKKGLTEDLAINLEAPRKWRLLRERTGHGSLYGMKIIIYGDCIVPPLDTLKRAVKAGDGIILATSPPYTRFLESGIDFAIVSEVMPRCDVWVQEFLRHEIPCVLPDYLVSYVCKPGFPLNNYVQYNTHAWAEASLKKHTGRLEEVIEELVPSDDETRNDLACQVCGSHDRGEVMLICGDESGFRGCGVGMHVDCCDPPLECVPEEDWFCPMCSKVVQSKTSTRTKSKKGTAASKRKK